MYKSVWYVWELELSENWEIGDCETCGPGLDEVRVEVEWTGGSECEGFGEIGCVVMVGCYGVERADFEWGIGVVAEVGKWLKEKAVDTGMVESGEVKDLLRDLEGMVISNG